MCTLLQFNDSTLVGKDIRELFRASSKNFIELANFSEESNYFQLLEFPELYAVTQPLRGDFSGLSISIMDYRHLGSFFGSSPSTTVLNRAYEKILENGSFGIMVCDSCGKVIIANENMALRLGMERSSLEGLEALKLLERGYLNVNIVSEAILTKSPVTSLVRYLRTGKTVTLTACPILASDAQVKMVLVTQRDLTHYFDPDVLSNNEREILDSLSEEFSGRPLEKVTRNSFVSNSPIMRRTLDAAYKFSRSQIQTILLTGEPGTEKRKIARYIHDSSLRSDEPFLSINCTDFEEKELEGAIFGCERGALGQPDIHSYAGAIQAVGRGTLYLENFHQTSLPFQLKILVFLEKHEYCRVGGVEPFQSKAAIFFSANANLEVLVKKKSFLEELYLKLNDFHINVPSLRHRSEDIVDMAREKLLHLNSIYGLSKYLDHEAIDVLQGRSFQANVVELETAIYQAALFSVSPNIGAFLKAYFKPVDPLASSSHKQKVKIESPPFDDKIPGFTSVKVSGLMETLDLIEKRLLMETIVHCRSTREMATILGISQAGVSRKLRKYNLRAPGKYLIKS
jgi:DNA-binding NtrC family response regulator/PAS domain-containing protein